MRQTEMEQLLQEMHAMLCSIVAMLKAQKVAENEVVTQLKGVVPPVLQTPDKLWEVLARAVECGLVEVTDMGLRWMSKPMLLAYLCGRLWAGDRARLDRDTGVVTWCAGPFTFPAIALQQLFHCRGMKQNRDSYLLGNPPKGYEAIDELLTAESVKSQ